MKKLVMILMLGVTMASCNNTPTKVKNPKQVTTLELQQLASIDTTTYKVVEKDNTVYILSTKDTTVVKKVKNESGAVESLILAVFIVFIVMWIGMALI
jgi:photosystem II stability/assembly factor-like uncharacterized protein